MICLLGGAGFIGTRLAQLLTRVDRPFYIVDKVPSRKFPSQSRIADVRSLESLRSAIAVETTAVILLAAEHMDNVTPRSLYDEVNVEGARNVCQVLEELHIPQIVFTSTVAVYGFAPVNTDETGEIKPFNDYGRTKAEAEKVLTLWYSSRPKERKLTIVRPTVVFGENNRGNVYNLIRQIATRRFAMIGDGKNYKSIAYVENVAAFLHHVLTLPAGRHVFNYVDKPDYDMNTLVSKIRNALGVGDTGMLRIPRGMALIIAAATDAFANIAKQKFPISRVRVRKFCENTSFATSARSTHFSPPVSLDEALHRTIAFEFHEAHGDRVVFTSE